MDKPKAEYESLNLPLGSLGLLLITMIPSSKLTCGFKCWDSSNLVSLSNIFSVGHEEKKVNER